MEVREATIGKFRGHDVVTLGAEGKPPTRARIVIVRPGESANRRVYPSDTIAEAVRTGFWNDSKMFIDHGDIKMPTHRSIKDLVGVIESTDVGPAGEAVGEVRFVRPEFAQFAMEAKDAIGVSIVHQFQGQRFKGTDGHYHERVDRFLTNYSVDWVAYPAAGGAISEFIRESEDEDDVEWEQLTPEMLKEHARLRSLDGHRVGRSCAGCPAVPGARRRRTRAGLPRGDRGPHQAEGRRLTDGTQRCSSSTAALSPLHRCP
jgi:hypothetical protein